MFFPEPSCPMSPRPYSPPSPRVPTIPVAQPAYPQDTQYFIPTARPVSSPSPPGIFSRSYTYAKYSAYATTTLCVLPWASRQLFPHSFVGKFSRAGVISLVAVPTVAATTFLASVTLLTTFKAVKSIGRFLSDL